MALSRSPILLQDLAKLGVLTGRWVGEIDGEPIEEVWLPEIGGEIVATFRWFKQGRPYLYEFIQLCLVGNAAIMRLKHFGPDMVGWEAVDAWTEFVLVACDDRSFRFIETGKENPPWLIYTLDGESLTVHFEREGAPPPVKGTFRYQRVPL